MHVITVCPKCDKDFMYHTTDTHLERGGEENKRILEEYPIQDETWASRRWNEDRTEYCDLSGCYHICQECDEEENKKATEKNIDIKMKPIILNRIYVLDLGGLVMLKVLDFTETGVICEYLQSWSGRKEEISYELFEMNGYKNI